MLSGSFLMGQLMVMARRGQYPSECLMVDLVEVWLPNSARNCWWFTINDWGECILSTWICQVSVGWRDDVYMWISFKFYRFFFCFSMCRCWAQAVCCLKATLEPTDAVFCECKNVCICSNHRNWRGSFAHVLEYGTVDNRMHHDGINIQVARYMMIDRLIDR